MKYFGSSGIRGVYGDDLTPDLARRVGYALDAHGTVVLGGDFRESTAAVESALVSGLLEAGVDVHYAGRVSTPTLAYAARNADVGVMVTASHNPPEYNGIKLWNPDGSGFSVEQMESVEDKIDSPQFRAAGKGNLTIYTDAVTDHIEAIEERVGELSISVAVDCGGGATLTITPALLADMGARVLSLNAHPDPLFTCRPSEPSPENLSLLRCAMSGGGFDLGIAHDGDGDRMVAFTRRGRFMGGDALLCLFASHFGFRRIAAPVDTSLMVAEFAEVVYTRVGDVFVSQEVKKGIPFGGEQSGTYIFGDFRYTPDGVYAAALLAQIAMEVDLDEFAASLPQFHTVRRSFSYHPDKRDEFVRRIEKLVASYGNPVTVDGWRVDMDDAWFLIRFSGTEPKIRVTVEARDVKRAESLMGEIGGALT